MQTEEVINSYIDEISRKLATGHAAEHAYRPALERLLESLVHDIEAVNDPKRQATGAPDFIIVKKEVNPNQTKLFKAIPLAFVEAKDINMDLDKIENQEQLTRYLELGNNVLHTDYLKFRFYFEKKLEKEIVLAELTNGQLQVNQEQYQLLAEYLKQLVQNVGITIRSAKQLAIVMADKAHWIKLEVLDAITSMPPNQEVIAQFEAFRRELIHDLTPGTFADLYAQTIAYGMFAARYHDDTSKDFSVAEAAEKLPSTNPFLQKFFREIAGYSRAEFLELSLNNFAEIFQYASVHNLMSKHGSATARNHDPVIHFYETFLGEYDPKARKARGVYYTPLPVVQFIVRAVDGVLIQEFNLNDGLADDSTIAVTRKAGAQNKRDDKKGYSTYQEQVPKVQILDPATGTGTFLNEVIKHVYKTKGKKLGSGWSSYVEQNLLKRIFGFELLMAPYAMAHMRLNLTLAQTGYTQSKTNNQRLGVYLTNTLEPPAEDDNQQASFAFMGMQKALSDESHAADSIKRDQPIMVVIGNPPYSISSSNKSKFIQNLIKSYKQHLNERKINLDDDYIKFIRYAQAMVDKNKTGVLAYISNNSFIDGITHRQMRKELLRSFDKIYILDLHGSSKKKEVAPDGGKDENVFDIMQGVSITIGVRSNPLRTGDEYGMVYHADLYGLRRDKYEFLDTVDFSKIKWQKLNHNEPYQFFVPKDFKLKEEYEQGIKITELFPLYSAGIKTKVDHIATEFEAENLGDRVEDIISNKLTKKQIKEKYGLNDNTTWEYSERSDITFSRNKLIEYNYRPFYKKYLYYDSEFLSRSRSKVMDHLLEDNFALSVVRQSRIDHQNVNAQVTTEPTCEDFVTNHTFTMPLYLYEDSFKQELRNE